MEGRIVSNRGDIRIGCSGWVYKHWRGLFYPEGLAQKRWFERYAEDFDTVEINASFYRVPLASTFDGWRDKAPPGFRYAVKANRFITHMSGLVSPFGRPKWDSRRTIAPRSESSSTVGSIARSRVSSVTFAPSIGTLRSTRTSTFLPARSSGRSSRVLKPLTSNTGSCQSWQRHVRAGAHVRTRKAQTLVSN